jgi:hypothetical protein
MRIKKVWAELYRVPVHMHDAIRHFSEMDVIFAYVETDEGANGCGFYLQHHPPTERTKYAR